MFEQGGRQFVGMVIQNDTQVVDLSRANVERAGHAQAVDRRRGSADRHADWRRWPRSPPSRRRPSPVAQLKTLPPIPDPSVLLNAAVNYSEHGVEMTGQATTAASADKVDPKVAIGIPGYWTPQAGRSASQPVLLPEGDQRRSPATAIRSSCRRGATQIDWECELNIVIGRTAKYVKAENAAEYIFGYTLDNDVSDRGGRADGRHGSDWVLGKSHDTFFPMGPYIVPRQFVPNPHEAADQVHAERQGDAGLEHRSHDAQRLRAGRVCVAPDDAAAGRHDLVGQPGRRRHRARHADLLQGRRHVDVHDRVDWNAPEPGEGGAR